MPAPTSSQLRAQAAAAKAQAAQLRRDHEKASVTGVILELAVQTCLLRADLLTLASLLTKKPKLIKRILRKDDTL